MLKNFKNKGKEFCEIASKILEFNKSGLYNKDGLINTKSILDNNLNGINLEIKNLENEISILKNKNSGNEVICQNILNKYDSIETIYTLYDNYKKIKKESSEVYKILETMIVKCGNFNKNLCFSNIRELLKQNHNVKIGQIEKEAGIRLGYMSRLEKEDNTSEPSMEFVATAAKLLNISIDTLISVDLTSLTPTEIYLIKFFDKLKADTLNDKICWNIETKKELNELKSDENGYVYHPLFNYETIKENPEYSNSNDNNDIVFNSKSFGLYTKIAGDCFNLKLNNRTTIYLMDIEKSVHNRNDSSEFAKEALIYVQGQNLQFLISSKDQSPIVSSFENLFVTVKERMKHPVINTDVMKAIEAYMNDEIRDEITDVDLPF